jgi:hypothetical protein
MLEKGFLRNQNNENNKHRQIAEKASQILQILGIMVLVGSFGYLLFNWGKNDFLIGMMMPFLVAGLGLILVSRLIKRAFSKLKR